MCGLAKEIWRLVSAAIGSKHHINSVYCNQCGMSALQTESTGFHDIIVWISSTLEQGCQTEIQCIPKSRLKKSQNPLFSKIKFPKVTYLQWRPLPMLLFASTQWGAVRGGARSLFNISLRSELHHFFCYLRRYASTRYCRLRNMIIQKQPDKHNYMRLAVNGALPSQQSFRAPFAKTSFLQWKCLESVNDRM